MVRIVFSTQSASPLRFGELAFHRRGAPSISDVDATGPDRSQFPLDGLVGSFAMTIGRGKLSMDRMLHLRFIRPHPLQLFDRFARSGIAAIAQGFRADATFARRPPCRPEVAVLAYSIAICNTKANCRYEDDRMRPVLAVFYPLPSNPRE